MTWEKVRIEVRLVGLALAAAGVVLLYQHLNKSCPDLRVDTTEDQHHSRMEKRLEFLNQTQK